MSIRLRLHRYRYHLQFFVVKFCKHHFDDILCVWAAHNAAEQCLDGVVDDAGHPPTPEEGECLSRGRLPVHKHDGVVALQGRVDEMGSHGVKYLAVRCAGTEDVVVRPVLRDMPTLVQLLNYALLLLQYIAQNK